MKNKMSIFNSFKLLGLHLFFGLTLFGYSALAKKSTTPEIVESEILPVVPMPAAAAACVACHGQQGISPAPLWPNLSGQKKEYLIKQITAFKEGTRKDPMMNPLSSNLTEADIESISSYFSSLPLQR